MYLCMLQHYTPCCFYAENTYKKIEPLVSQHSLLDDDDAADLRYCELLLPPPLTAAGGGEPLTTSACRSNSNTTHETAELHELTSIADRLNKFLLIAKLMFD